MSEFVRFVAWRYFVKSHRKHTFSVISLISICGLALGVATLIIVLSVMDGLIAKTEEIVLQSATHANVYRLIGNFDTYEDVEKQVESIPGVLGATPVVFREVLLTSKKGMAGAFLNGIDVEGYKKIADFLVLLNYSLYISSDLLNGTL